MDKNFQQPRDDTAESPKMPGTIQDLSKILADKKGRDFIVGLKDKEAELCMNLLDLVSCDLRLLLSPSHTVR